MSKLMFMKHPFWKTVAPVLKLPAIHKQECGGGRAAESVSFGDCEENNFYFLLSIEGAFYSCIITLVRISSTMLNRSDEMTCLPFSQSQR